MTAKQPRRKLRLTPGGVAMFIFFAWFILACLILPNLNLLKTVFFADGGFSMEPIMKLLKSKRAMKALRNSFILAPTLSITVGFVGYSYRENKADQMIAGAKKAREKCDLLIVSVHGGEENNYKMTSFMRTTTKKLVDVGADLVLCHHPHVYGPILTYNGKYIVGSLGNFCFGGNYIPKDKDTQIFQQTFLIYPDGTIEDGGINLIPCSVSSEKAHNNFQPTPLEGKEAEKLFNKFMKLSKLQVTDLNWMPGSYPELAGLLPTEEAE